MNKHQITMTSSWFYYLPTDALSHEHKTSTQQFSHSFYENTLRQIQWLRSQPGIKSDVFTRVCKYSVILDTQYKLTNCQYVTNYSRDRISHYGGKHRQYFHKCVPHIVKFNTHQNFTTPPINHTTVTIFV
jgi:hypothetical protein